VAGPQPPAARGPTLPDQNAQTSAVHSPGDDAVECGWNRVGLHDIADDEEADRSTENQEESAMRCGKQSFFGPVRSISPSEPKCSASVVTGEDNRRGNAGKQRRNHVDGSSFACFGAEGELPRGQAALSAAYRA
jgi:hypothetical protein